MVGTSSAGPFNADLPGGDLAAEVVDDFSTEALAGFFEPDRAADELLVLLAVLGFLV
jgi:hypothetical protein